MLNSSMNLITHLASGLEGDWYIGVVVNGFRRESLKTSGMCPCCRCVARTEEERGKKMTSPSDEWVPPISVMRKWYLGQTWMGRLAGPA
jgi:hypothetical protein